MSAALRVVAAGLAGGLAGNTVLGLAFSSNAVRTLLYDAAVQSSLFIELTAQRDIPVSVAGLIVLSVAHAWLYRILQVAVPGTYWVTKGLFWGFAIWLMYWVFQEWFIYRMLLREPWSLIALELTILLIGSLVEGLVIARMTRAPHRIPPTGRLERVDR